MKSSRLFLLIAGLMILTAGSLTAGQNTRVAVITGGHGFDRDAFFGMFEAMDGVEYVEVTQPGANDLYGSDEMDAYDVIVFYDMVQEITASQKKDFVKLLDEGVGMVFLHHALVSYQDWDLFHEVVGGKYVLRNTLDPEDSALASGFKHDENMRVMVVAEDHPVTSGMREFEIFDEVYINYQVGDHVVPLLETDHPLSTPLIGWANTHMNSRIAYLQLGHDHHAYGNDHYRQLVQRAVQWVARGDEAP